MSNNLPVIWVPPVEPPDPDERPPRRRGNFGVILAALAIVAVPLVAFAVVRETTPRTAEIPTPVAMEAPPVAIPVADVPLPAPKPATERVAIGPAPETSGGNQPYIAGSGAPARAGPAAPPAVVEPRTALGSDGKPIRVIGIDRPSSDMAPSATTGGASPERVVEETPAEAAAPSKPVAQPSPVVATEPRGTVAEPPVAPVAKPAPAVEAAKPATVEPKPAPVVEAKPAPAATPPVGLRTEPSAPAVAATPTPSAPDVAVVKPEKPPLPPKKEVAKTPRAGTAEAGRSDEADAFADRLAAIRRAEEPRPAAQPRPSTRSRATSRAQVEEPVYEDDDEEIVVAPRRRWGFAPPVFGGPTGPVLRPYEAPSRASMERAPQGENCHYHAWPTEDMAFHRDVRCHWHREPDDPSIRYVR